MADDAARWNERYAEADRLWSGNPNASLVREAGGLAPGSALDLGCGEGGDAIWLALRGWRVLGVDVSTTALERAAEEAVAAGVDDRVRFEQVDLVRDFPAGPFDLVTAHYVHTHGSLDALDLIGRAARVVAVGGTLLVVVHTAQPQWVQDEHAVGGEHGGAGHGHATTFPTAEEILGAVEGSAGEWETVTAAPFAREQAGPDGSAFHRTDLAVRVRRAG